MTDQLINFQNAFNAGEPVLVLFDCDGTLIDSAAVIHEVMCRCFSNAGLQTPTFGQTKSIIGLSLEFAISQLTGLSAHGTQVQSLTTSYKEIFVSYRSEEGFSEPLFDGVGNLLEQISSSRNLLAGVVTGKSRRGLNVVSRHNGFEWLVKLARTADDCPSKPHPAMVLECCAEVGVDPSHCIVIGDTTYDMEMARNAGVQCAAVTYGAHDKTRLDALKPDYSFDDFTSLKAWLLDD